MKTNYRGMVLCPSAPRENGTTMISGVPTLRIAIRSGAMKVSVITLHYHPIADRGADVDGVWLEQAHRPVRGPWPLALDMYAEQARLLRKASERK